MINQFTKTTPVFATAVNTSNIQRRSSQHDHTHDEELFALTYQKQVEAETDKLQSEQDQYDSLVDLEYRLMDFKSEVRKERQSLESAKSQLKMAKIVAESQFQALQSQLQFTIQSLDEKLQRELGTSQGYQDYFGKQIAQQKKEDEQFQSYLLKLEQRVSQIEYELG